jgi:hypothetical protein
VKEAPTLARRLLQGWLGVAARFGEVQTLVLLGVVYALVLGPVAIVAGVLRRDFLSKRGLREASSAWLQAETATPELQRSKHPF